MRSPGFVALALVLACNPDEPATSATNTGTATTTGSTGTATGTATSTSDTPTSSGSATAGMTATTSTSTTTTSTTDPATTDPVTTTTTTSTTSSTTGGVDPQCLPAVGDYGACQAVLGWAFDGEQCTLLSGCDCAPDCDKFFPDPTSCALSCAAADHCDTGKLEAAGLASDPVQPGDHCDGLYMCPGDDDPLKQAYQQIFGMLSCEPGAFPCGPELCAGLWSGSLGPDEWQKLCAASLLPMSGPFYCTVFGP